MNVDSIAANLENIKNKMVDESTVTYLKGLTKYNEDGTQGMYRLINDLKTQEESVNRDYVVEYLTILCELTSSHVEGKFDINSDDNFNKPISELVEKFKGSTDKGISLTSMFVKEGHSDEDVKIKEIPKSNTTLTGKCIVLLDDDTMMIRR